MNTAVLELTGRIMYSLLVVRLYCSYSTSYNEFTFQRSTVYSDVLEYVTASGECLCNRHNHIRILSACGVVEGRKSCHVMTLLTSNSLA